MHNSAMVAAAFAECSICKAQPRRLRNLSILYCPPRWELGSIYIKDICSRCYDELEKTEIVPSYISEKQHNRYIRKRIRKVKQQLEEDK